MVDGGAVSSKVRQARRAAIGGALVMLAAGLLSGCSGSPPAAPDAPQAPGPDVILVENTVNLGPNGATERTWAVEDGTAERTQTFSAGRLSSDRSLRSDLSEVYVDHDSRTYRTSPAQVCDDPVKCGGPPIPSPYSAAAVAESTRNGHMKAVDDAPVVDGRRVLHLQGDYDSISLAGTVDLWVDATTYRPIRFAVSNASTLREGTVTYLPGTPENIAQLTAPIPADFTRQ